MKSSFKGMIVFILLAALAAYAQWPGGAGWGGSGSGTGTGVPDTSYVQSDILVYYPPPDIPNPASYWAWSSRLFVAESPLTNVGPIEIATGDTELFVTWSKADTQGLMRSLKVTLSYPDINHVDYCILDSLRLFVREFANAAATKAVNEGRALVTPACGADTSIRLSSFCLVPMPPTFDRDYATNYVAYSDTITATTREITVTVQTFLVLNGPGQIYIANLAAKTATVSLEIGYEWSDSLVDFGPMSYYHIDESLTNVDTAFGRVTGFSISGLGAGYAWGNSFSAASWHQDNKNFWRYFWTDRTPIYSIMSDQYTTGDTVRMYRADPGGDLGDTLLLKGTEMGDWGITLSSFTALTGNEDMWAIAGGNQGHTEILFPLGTSYWPSADSGYFKTHGGYALRPTYADGDTIYWLWSDYGTHKIDTDVGANVNLPGGFFQTVWGSAKLRGTLTTGPKAWLHFYPVPLAFNSTFDMMGFNDGLPGRAMTAVRSVQYSWTTLNGRNFVP
jgi:hypothetical protein